MNSVTVDAACTVSRHCSDAACTVSVTARTLPALSLSLLGRCLHRLCHCSDAACTVCHYSDAACTVSATARTLSAPSLSLLGRCLHRLCHGSDAACTVCHCSDAACTVSATARTLPAPSLSLLGRCLHRLCHCSPGINRLTAEGVCSRPGPLSYPSRHCGGPHLMEVWRDFRVVWPLGLGKPEDYTAMFSVQLLSKEFGQEWERHTSWTNICRNYTCALWGMQYLRHVTHVHTRRHTWASCYMSACAAARTAAQAQRRRRRRRSCAAVSATNELCSVYPRAVGVAVGAVGL